MNYVLKAVLVTAMLSTSACATVTKGTEDTVRLESSPPTAQVTIEDTRHILRDVSCVTPCKLELNRKWAYYVTFEKKGYASETHLLEPKLSGDGIAGMGGNILLGGIIGAGVDASTGAMNDLRPNPLFVTLQPNGSDQPVATLPGTDLPIEPISSRK
ncbi:MAG: translation initiation factor 2 [Henriciella sp.]